MPLKTLQELPGQVIGGAEILEYGSYLYYPQGKYVGHLKNDVLTFYGFSNVLSSRSDVLNVWGKAVKSEVFEIVGLLQPDSKDENTCYIVLGLLIIPDKNGVLKQEYFLPSGTLGGAVHKVLTRANQADSWQIMPNSKDAYTEVLPNKAWLPGGEYWKYGEGENIFKCPCIKVRREDIGLTIRRGTMPYSRRLLIHFNEYSKSLFLRLVDITKVSLVVPHYTLENKDA